MTVPFSEVRPASLKMRVIPKYPASYRAGPGIAIDQAAGVVTTSVDFTNLERDDITDPTSLYVGAWDPSENLFKLFKGSNFKGDPGTPGTPGTAGSGYRATSTTSLLIGTGSKTFTTQASLAYTVGARTRAASAANPVNYMEGLVTAYSGTTLTVNVTRIGGSGTLADWNLNLAGDPGSGNMDAANNLSDLTNLATARQNLGVSHVFDITASPFNAKGDYSIAFGVTMGSGSAVALTSTPQFTVGDVGKYIIVQGAASGGLNLVTTIQSFTNSQNITLAAANASGGLVSGAQIEYGTDDASAINAAIQAAVTAGGGVVLIPAGRSFLISQINLTGIGLGITIRGDSGVSSSKLMPMQTAASGTSNGHVIDLTGSSQLTLDNFQIGSFQTLAVAPSALFFGQTNSNAANRVRVRNLYVSGRYSGATVYVYGTPSFEMFGSDFYNYQPGAGAHGAMCLTRTNSFGYTSAFATIATGSWNMSDVHFFNCEFHKFGGTGADSWVISMDGATNIAFYGGVINGGATAYVFYDGTIAHISYFNTTFENEGPATVTVPLYGHYKNSGTITDLIDPGCSYGYSSGKFNIASTTANVVSNSL